MAVGPAGRARAAGRGAPARALALFALLWALPLLAQALAPVPPLTSPVIDTTGTLDAGTRQRLEQQALALQQRKGAQLQVLIVPTTQPEDIAQYAVRAYETYRLGREKTDDGVLVVVAKDDRRVRIEVGYGLEGAIPDAIAARVVQEYLVPKFRAGDFGGGLVDATAALVRLIDGEPLPPPMAVHGASEAAEGSRGGGGWVVALIAAFLVAQVMRGLFRRAPMLVRGMAGGGAAGALAWLMSALLPLGLLAAVIGFFLSLPGGAAGRYARSGVWVGGGGFGGGGLGGGGFGGGWSGGGGMSGGGGASGSW